MVSKTKFLCSLAKFTQIVEGPLQLILFSPVGVT